MNKVDFSKMNIGFKFYEGRLDAFYRSTNYWVCPYNKNDPKMDITIADLFNAMVGKQVISDNSCIRLIGNEAFAEPVLIGIGDFRGDIPLNMTLSDDEQGRDLFSSFAKKTLKYMDNNDIKINANKVLKELK